MTFDLQLIGSRALVTGGTRGLGAAVVATLHRAGAHVVAAARSLPAQPIDKAHYVVADLATADDCAALAKHVLKRHGGLDIVVNVVGGSRAPAGGFAASDDAVWRQELNQNLMPAVRIDRALLPPMIEQGSGVIIRRLHRSDCVGQIQAVDAKLAAGGQGGSRRFQDFAPFSEQIWLRVAEAVLLVGPHTPGATTMTRMSPRCRNFRGGA